MIQKRNKLTWIGVSCISVILTMACQPGRKDATVPQDEDVSWAMIPFVKVDSVNPVLVPGTNTFRCPILQREVQWEEKDVFNPAAVVRDDTIFLLYRAEDTQGKFNGTSRIGLAASTDGLSFTKFTEPVLYPENDSLKHIEWEGGCEDPRVVETEDGSYVMTYTAYDGTTARLLIATSHDLVHWKKHGIALQGKHTNTWSKSGAIVARHEGSRVIATKIDGKYWMYFGDTNLYMATSTDLIHWNALEDGGELIPVLSPRPGHFDSRLVESGPFALVTARGILLIYNSMNLETGGDPSIAPGAYCAGQALFDGKNPSQVISRLERNFLRPDQPYELEGQINQVCFVEGLVSFRGKWFLYYGTADSKIAVAVNQ